MNKKQLLCSVGMLATLTSAAFAKAPEQHTVVAPQCLLNQVKTPFNTLAQAQSFSLISTSEKGIDALIDAKHATRKQGCGGFIDVTLAAQQNNLSNAALLNHYLPNAQSKSLTEKKYAIQYPEQVDEALKQINPQAAWDDLTNLTSRPDRYARSDEGVKAAQWIKSQIEVIAKNSGHDDVTVYFVKTGGGYSQPSVVAKMGNSTEPGIVIGGHMDTLSSSWELKPGADDDGSGSVTVMNVARTLLSSGMHFKKPIYFIWYAAEEQGLVGSGYVVSDFVSKKIPVDAVMQFDMTGYRHKNDPTMWLMDDYVNKDLSAYVEKLISTYVKQPIKHSRCGYACSDHASWHQAGFSASMPFEASFGTDNPYIHTAQDKMDALSLDHITNFTKLGVAYAIELAEPTA